MRVCTKRKFNYVFAYFSIEVESKWEHEPRKLDISESRSLRRCTECGIGLLLLLRASWWKRNFFFFVFLNFQFQISHESYTCWRHIFGMKSGCKVSPTRLPKTNHSRMFDLSKTVWWTKTAEQKRREGIQCIVLASRIIAIVHSNSFREVIHPRMICLRSSCGRKVRFLTEKYSDVVLEEPAPSSLILSPFVVRF